MHITVLMIFACCYLYYKTEHTAPSFYPFTDNYDFFTFCLRYFSGVR